MSAISKNLLLLEAESLLETNGGISLLVVGGPSEGWAGGAGLLAKPNLMIQMTGGRT